MPTAPDSFAALASRLDEAVKAHLGDTIAATADSADERAPEFSELLTASVAGGKRLRAIAAAVGALTADQHGDLESVLDRHLLALGAALEFYQAAALVHDDVVDRSPLRRGGPATHSALSSMHGDLHWHGDSDHFGIAGAILLGDFLLSAADIALEQSAPDSTLSDVRARFALMTAEVAYGQYLDVRATQTDLDASESVLRALQIVRLKSARYSVVHPVALGAISHGASSATLSALEAIFEPAGVAFQLRDDYLGVFGDPAITGKPVGSDLSEKKRTALLAISFAEADRASRQTLQSFYTAAEPATSQEEAEIGQIITRYGVEPHEALITEYRHAAITALETAAFSAPAKQACWSLIDRLIERDS